MNLSPAAMLVAVSSSRAGGLSVRHAADGRACGAGCWLHGTVKCDTRPGRDVDHTTPASRFLGRHSADPAPLSLGDLSGVLLIGLGEQDEELGDFDFNNSST